MEIDELYNKEAEENIIAICLTSQEMIKMSEFYNKIY